MRHFLCLAFTPGALPGGVPRGSALAQLVVFGGAALRIAPADLRALTRAVDVAVVTVAADAYLLRTAPATVQPIGLLACLHAAHTRHWTKPRITGIKARRACAYARERVEGPGFFQELARAFVYPASGKQDTASTLPAGKRAMRSGHIGITAWLAECV